MKRGQFDGDPGESGGGEAEAKQQEPAGKRLERHGIDIRKGELLVVARLSTT